jgi:hypothetical protein
MLAGGLGKDIFAYAPGYGADTILDFLQADGDAIDLSSVAGIGSVLDAIARGVQLLTDAVFDFGNGEKLTVTNVQIGSLGVSDFILAPVPPTQIIEQAGTTSLVQVGNGFFMPSVGATSGPQLMIGGASVGPELPALGDPLPPSPATSWPGRTERPTSSASGTPTPRVTTCGLPWGRSRAPIMRSIARDTVPPGPQWRRQDRRQQRGPEWALLYPEWALLY